MSWGEAVRLVGLLAKDPSTQTAAALNRWAAPRTFEWLVLVDLFDAFVQANFKRPQTYPRPFADPNDKHHGKTDLPRAQVISLLNRHGHSFDEEEE
jgi:hypothetical protein